MRIALCVDTESLVWFKPSPLFGFKEKVIWNINKLRNYRYAKGLDGFWNLYETSVRFQIPITFFCVEEIRMKLSAILYNIPHIELGSHSVTHECLLGMSDKQLEFEFDGISELVPCDSFAAPMNMIEDINQPERVYSLLKDKDIKIIRYVGTDNFQFKQQYHQDSISPIEIRYGVKCVHGSIYFEGKSNQQHINKVIDMIHQSSTLGDEYILCISMHDFTFTTKGLENFLKVYNVAKNHKLVTFRELAKED